MTVVGQSMEERDGTMKIWNEDIFTHKILGIKVDSIGPPLVGEERGSNKRSLETLQNVCVHVSHKALRTT